MSEHQKHTHGGSMERSALLEERQGTGEQELVLASTVLVNYVEEKAKKEAKDDNMADSRVLSGRNSSTVHCLAAAVLGAWLVESKAVCKSASTKVCRRVCHRALFGGTHAHSQPSQPDSGQPDTTAMAKLLTMLEMLSLFYRALL